MIGVAIISFNRPYYLRRLLKTLEKQTSQKASYMLFQDGAVNKFSGRRYANNESVDACIKLFKRAKLPNKQLHIRKENVGVSNNIKAALDFMAQNFDRLMMVEDDVLLTPHWMRLAGILFNEMADRPKVASFSPGFRRYCKHYEIAGSLSGIQETTQHMWCESFTADTWRRMQPHLAPYYELINGIDYLFRDDDPIQALHKSRGSKEKGTSQDVARVVAIELEGMVRAQCTVNRGFSIGRSGIHFDNARYVEYKLGEQRPYVFSEDAERDSFEWWR